MKIIVAAVGSLKEKYLQSGAEEYLKRMKPFADIATNEIDEARLPKNPAPAEVKKAVADEGKRLLKSIPGDAYLFALDLHGQSLTSENFAAKIAAITADGKSRIAFAVGGTFGIAPVVTDVADFRLCLSPMTFTHQMTRIILLEQIYRAFKINRGEKYHW